MATQIRSNYRTIIAAIKQKLISDLELENHQVLISQRPVNFQVQTDRYLILRSQNPVPASPIYAAAGRVDLELVRPVQVHLRTRLAYDEIDRDDTHLLHETEGHYVTEDAILESLVGYGPIDDDENLLTTHPLELLPSISVTVDEIDPHWDESVFVFRVQYVSDLDQSVVF